MLTSAVKYRQFVAQLYQYSAESVAHLVPEFVPWTASSAVRAVIRRQVVLACHSGISIVIKEIQISCDVAV